MILFDFDRTRLGYLACSPYRNLIASAWRDPRVEVRLRGIHPPADPADYAAVVTDAPAQPRPAGVPSLYLTVDLHRHTPERLDEARRAMAGHDVVLSPLRYARLPDDLPHVTERERGNMVCFPHCVPDAEPLPRSPGLDTAVAVAPAHPRPYPMLAALRGRDLPGMTWLDHPGYDPVAMRAAQDAWWPTLARHAVGVVGLGYGRGGYPLAKYVEYLHAGLILLAEKPLLIDREFLGLVDGENCVLLDWPDESDRFDCVYEWSREIWSPVARAGQRLARGRHTARRRIDYLERICAFWSRERRAPNAVESIDLFNHAAGAEKSHGPD